MINIQRVDWWAYMPNPGHDPGHVWRRLVTLWGGPVTPFLLLIAAWKPLLHRHQACSNAQHSLELFKQVFTTSQHCLKKIQKLLNLFGVRGSCQQPFSADKLNETAVHYDRHLLQTSNQATSVRDRTFSTGPGRKGSPMKNHQSANVLYLLGWWPRKSSGCQPPRICHSYPKTDNDTVSFERWTSHEDTNGYD